MSLDIAHLIPLLAGTTPEERESFSEVLGRGFVDVFRHLHPNAQGWFSYWSVRAGNKPFNRGLRLDYFVASRELVHDEKGSEGGGTKSVRVVDTTILDEFVALDHAAIALTLTA